MIWDHPQPAVGVDLVLLSLGGEGLEVLLRQRATPPFDGQLALPGGIARSPSEVTLAQAAARGLDLNLGSSETWEGIPTERWDPDLEAAARRVARESVGLERLWLEQLYTFSALGRDPRGPVISVAWLGLLAPTERACAQGQWIPWDSSLSIAFDHNQILDTARERLRGKVDYVPDLAPRLLAAPFTAAELRAAHAAILGQVPNRGSIFRRLGRWVEDGVLTQVGERATGRRPAKLYALA
ncbi:MAG: hypothetical protein VX899_22910 [Myxococcota bacterium]|nr:hypothetical protein [Myxococcota bacterium]